jgi:transcriptional regulator
MYNVPYFKAKDNSHVFAFMQAHPFITLCGVNAFNKPVATHIPIIIVQEENMLRLYGHVMKKQDHTVAFENNAHVLAIFTGANTYISATHYTPQNTASTWNYGAVHANGILNFVDEDKLLWILETLTNQFEQHTNSPASFKQLPKAYVAEHIKAIKGFCIEITQVEHVFKYSQNKDEATRDKITEALTKGTMQEKKLADDMKKLG